MIPLDAKAEAARYRAGKLKTLRVRLAATLAALAAIAAAVIAIASRF